MSERADSGIETRPRRPADLRGMRGIDPGYPAEVFDDFTLTTVDVDGLSVWLRHGGHGSPVVLLHGHPRTHTTWHAVAPLLAQRYTVICPDLPGYGRSGLGPDLPGHQQSSKRTMAAVVVALLRQMGHEQFAVVGHDRGAAVAYRTALDHERVVSQLVVMDSLPLVEHLERTDARFAQIARTAAYERALPQRPQGVPEADPSQSWR